MYSARLEPTLIDGDLTDIIKDIRSFDAGVIRLRFLATPAAPPYKVKDSSGVTSEDVTISGGIQARYVGIQKCEKVASDRYIVSNGFAVCVPVVVMRGLETWLAHCNYQGGIEEFRKDWSAADASVIVLAKKDCRQTQEAKGIFNKLSTDWGFQYVSICELPTAEYIGVVVRGDTILAYRSQPTVAT
jgi:hypothetical protein